MASWSQTPKWNAASSINSGKEFQPHDGITADDMNNIIENLLYIKKYGSKINTLSIGATVEGTTLKLTSEEI